jgi:hypothetical protein
VSDPASSGDRSAVDHVADLVVYAPLGLALEARRLLPEMAARGRRQVLFTRTVGKYAVRRGQKRLDDVVATGVGLVSAFLPGRPDAEPEVGTAEVEVAADLAPTPVPAVEPGPDSDHLAIPDYDSLSAFQVMPRLEALDTDDLAAVRDYEESTRGRRTILNKIAQLS